MSETVISVENLGKQYTLRHKRSSERYTTLRDVLARQAAAPIKAIGEKMRARIGLNGSRRNGSAYRSTDGVENFWALKNVSFEVKQGEVVGIIGRNGAGKSTILKILSRITEPTEGRIRIKGRVASLLEVGTGFHPELTGRENIFLNGAILGMKRQEIRNRFDEIVTFAEVEKFLDTPVKRYSSGMYVRLAFAVSAHLQTDILIVDEVLAVGDAEFQKKCLGKMQEVASGQGRTVLFVSHQIAAVRRLCTAACLMNDGQTQGITSVDAAVNAYTSRMKGSPLDLDLSGITRQHDWGQTAKIRRIRIARELSFQYGEPLELVFTIECSSAVTNAIVGISFDTQDGSRVLTLDTDNTPGCTLELPAGTHEVRFKVDRNPLHPTTYNCTVGLGSGTHMLDYVTNFAIWEVSPARHGVESTRGYSGCRLPVNVWVTPAENIDFPAATVGCLVNTNDGRFLEFEH